MVICHLLLAILYDSISVSVSLYWPALLSAGRHLCLFLDFTRNVSNYSSLSIKRDRDCLTLKGSTQGFLV